MSIWATFQTRKQTRRNTRLANAEKAKQEEKSKKDRLDRDLRSLNRAENRESITATTEKATQADYNLLKEQNAKLKELEVQYYANLQKEKEIETNQALALIQARAEAARVETALETAKLASEEARLAFSTNSKGITDLKQPESNKFSSLSFPINPKSLNR